MPELNANPMDLDVEFKLLSQLVNDLWQGCDTEEAKKALRFSFEKGLEDAKLWIDEYTTLTIGEILNAGKMEFPLNARREIPFEGDKTAYLYDALYMFDSTLSSGLRDIHRSVTGYGRWDYSKNANSLCRIIRKAFCNLEVQPKNQDKDTQSKIINTYTGHFAEEAGSFSTPERLRKTYVEYSRDDQGMSLFRSLFSTVYSHALYCAKVKNTQALINDLLPIYRKRNDPINFDNGDEIFTIASKNRFIGIINAMTPFEFSSSEKYLEEKEQAKKFQADNAEETPEQKEQRVRELTREIISNIDKSIDIEDKRINTCIDATLPKIESYKLSK